MEYRVVWVIDVDEDNEHDAARRACEIMKRPYDESIAHYFRVLPTAEARSVGWPTLGGVVVDLDELDGKGDL